MKGRIIGKEGRNIRTFQKETGTELIVDETPETVVVSSFNPLRRHIAKVSLERLIADGRIQPARIEETVSDVKKEFSHKVRELGKEAVYELGITEFEPKLVYLIGMLYFRTSYGQNVLKHSVEMGHIGTIIAEELDADVTVVKKGCLLHDIGKAVSHEVEGSHVEIGKRIMERFGIDERVIEAASAHHEDYPFSTIESRIIQATDAISASRPGARKDDYESYIKRLEELESLAKSFDGVERAFAIQAGREIRIFVHPREVKDTGAYRLAKKVSKKIEKDLSYPGEVKVNVIRETRAVEYAR
jgi:ribonuclease Y